MSRLHKTVSRIAPQVDRVVVTYYPVAARTNAISPCVLFVGTSHIPYVCLQSVTLKFLRYITETFIPCTIAQVG